MPIRNTSIFEDLPARLDSTVNPYVRQLQEGRRDDSLPALYGPWLKGLKGNWNKHFQDSDPEGKVPAKIILEIGVHMGKTLLEMAETHPEYGFIGLDITFKRVVTTARKAKERGLSNVVSVLADARALEHLFEPGELDGTLVFFPDPWLKKKNQRHHRLLNEDFLQRLKGCLKPESFFWLKTDAKEYFDLVSDSLLQNGYTQLRNPQGIPAEEYLTVFEHMFRCKKLPTYSGQWLC